MDIIEYQSKDMNKISKVSLVYIINYVIRISDYATNKEMKKKLKKDHKSHEYFLDNFERMRFFFHLPTLLLPLFHFGIKILPHETHI